MAKFQTRQTRVFSSKKPGFSGLKIDGVPGFSGPLGWIPYLQPAAYRMAILGIFEVYQGYIKCPVYFFV
jgi:hypothetical protein